tara:strand:- start:66 stop:497 length:432 start_codon:yes stop_codon:yes gene_type:complete
MGYYGIMKNKKRKDNMNTKYIKNDKMNKDTYKLRSRVMELIYEALDYGIKLPRINVRIGQPTKGNENTLGVGGQKWIWITRNAMNKSTDKALSTDYLRHVVFHEIGHAVFNLPHNEKCPLMASTLSSPCTRTQALEILKGYSR